MGGKILNVACVLLMLLSVSFAERLNVSVQVPVTDVTVYSNGIAFVKRDRSLDLTAGELSLLIKNFTSSAVVESVSVSDDKGSVREIARYSNVRTKNETKYLTFEEILNESIGSNVTALTKNGLKGGVLSWFGSDRLGITAGNKFTVLKFEDIEEFEAPISKYKKDVEVNETEKGLRIDELSTAGSHKISVSYLNPGVSWSANYKYYMTSDTDTGEGTLQAWAGISNNAGEDWKDVKLRVAVGYPHMLSYGSLVDYTRKQITNAGGMAYASEAAPAIISDFVSAFVGEYYIYTLSEPATINDGETRNLPLFDGAVKFKREYIWDTAWERPHKVYKLNNSLDQSWAAGTARIYLNGEFIGEDSIKYTPKLKEAEVTVADVPEIVVKKLVNSTSGQEYQHARTTTYKVSLNVENRKDERVELRVRDWMNSGDVVTLLTSNPTAERKEQNKLEWKITLNKGESRTIEYTYTVTNYYYY
ncbi:MAG: hypothetical protein Sv326_0306 [Candidatus Fermentimicrarchaeum limneticum]|uniref:DUF4139 domain-containing protein n=1 Tax=Fermentimicrarchaeum limneticum TaxID=2795018 RepID=A0A7D6BSP3_FERL1|nr:MAG: hypothetical protein Sv326_0306 [Candidatus Fermentimicrarchaeum limneticum]